MCRCGYPAGFYFGRPETSSQVVPALSRRAPSSSSSSSARPSVPLSVPSLKSSNVRPSRPAPSSIPSSSSSVRPSRRRRRPLCSVVVVVVVVVLRLSSVPSVVCRPSSVRPVVVRCRPSSSPSSVVRPVRPVVRRPSVPSSVRVFFYCSCDRDTRLCFLVQIGEDGTMIYGFRKAIVIRSRLIHASYAKRIDIWSAHGKNIERMSEVLPHLNVA